MDMIAFFITTPSLLRLALFTAKTIPALQQKINDQIEIGA